MNDKTHPQSHPAWEDLQTLLIERAMWGLGPDQQAELDNLMREVGWKNDDSFDLAAATVDVVVGVEEEMEQLPAHLAEKIIASSEAHLGTDFASTSINVADTNTDNVRTTIAETNRDKTTIAPPTSAPGFRRRDLLSILAIAASLLLAAILWFDKPNPTRSLTAAQQMDIFLTEPPSDLVRISWSPTDEEAKNEMGGEVVWSSLRQEGYMTFSGLPENDPSVEQYQLWVFDKNRDEKYPVDGGVFNVSDSGQQTVVPIDAKIKVDQATLFAITIEKPGGVVVSDRSRLPLIAPVK